MIELNKVSKIYGQGQISVAALKNVNLSMKQGEFLVLLGPSGSGKTTMLNIVGGIDKATEGQIIVDGEDITTYSENQLTQYRRNVGFIFQFFNLIPTLTAKENVEFAAELAAEPMVPEEALSLVGLGERIHHFPSELSGGEQQRVAIARALVKNPRIVLCDEPTGELDFETGKMILKLMRDINRANKKAFVVVTHNSAIADIADRVVRLRSGQIVQDKANPSPMEPEELHW